MIERFNPDDRSSAKRGGRVTNLAQGDDTARSPTKGEKENLVPCRTSLLTGRRVKTSRSEPSWFGLRGPVSSRSAATWLPPSAICRVCRYTHTCTHTVVTKVARRRQQCEQVSDALTTSTAFLSCRSSRIRAGKARRSLTKTSSSAKQLFRKQFYRRSRRREKFYPVASSMLHE